MSATSAIETMQHVRYRSFHQGDCALSVGQSSADWIHIVSGLVASCGPSTGHKFGDLTLTGIFGPNSWILRECSLAEEPVQTQSDYICMTATLAMFVPGAGILSALKTDAGFSHHLVRIAFDDMQRLRRTLSYTRLAGADLRILIGLASLCAELDRAVSHPDYQGPDSDLTLPLSQVHMASLLGVSRCIFSSTANILSRAGWLRIHYGRLEFLGVRRWIFLHGIEMEIVEKMRSQTLLQVVDEVDHLSADLIQDASAKAPLAPTKQSAGRVAL